MNMATILSLTR